MSRPVTLDPAAPIRGLLDAAQPSAGELAARERWPRHLLPERGMTQGELAARLNVASATVGGYLAAGDRAQLSTLLRAAEAVGGKIEIRFVRRKAPDDELAP